MGENHDFEDCRNGDEMNVNFEGKEHMAVSQRPKQPYQMSRMKKKMVV